MRAASVDVAGLGDDLHSVLGVEQQPQPGAHDRVVVGEHDADRRHGRDHIRACGYAEDASSAANAG